MFFFLSKTLDALVSPLTWTLLLLAAALIFWTRRRRLAFGCALAALAILAVFSSGVISDWLWRVLEAPAQSTLRAGVQYDAVIVLSGMVDAEATEAHGQPSYNNNIERLLSAYQLLRDGRAKNVLLSGGSGRLDRSGLVEADVLATQLKDWGIDPSRIVEYRLSRSTRENAVESAKVVAERGWTSHLVVTSAFHMPRALACFAQAGLKVDALPVDYRAGNGASPWFPRADALYTSAGALRELFGRLVYRVVGYSR